MNIPPFIYIDTPQKLEDCFQDLQKQKRIGIDLESNSLYVYKEYICLIQISTESTDYIIDPLPFDPIELAPFGDLLADASIQKVFHACEYDLILLKREYDWKITNLFDTMWAARILGIQKIGLASLLENYFDISLEKAYQTADWGSRPLSSEMLAYAQKDTHFLFQLQDKLAVELAQGGHLDESNEIFERQCDVTLPDTDFRPHQFWDLHGVRDLSNTQKRIGFALYLFRDEMAKKYNKPVFKIIDNKAIISLATKHPTGLGHLFDTRGISNWFIRKEGRLLLSRVDDALSGPMPKRPKRPPRPPQDLLDRYDFLLNWRKLRARKRGVESDIILSKDAVWEIAKENPNSFTELSELSTVIGPWRLKTYGNEIITELKKYAQHPA